MKWFRVLLTMFLLIGMLLCVSPLVYADDPPDEDPDMKVDIGIDGDLKVDIGVSGAAELNVGVEGPAEVNIKAGDEVKLNVEASGESQVFVDDQSLDNPTQKPDEPAGYQETGHNDPPVTYRESADVDDHASRLNSYLATLGAFPAAGLLAFFLIRRAKNNKNKGETE